MTDEIFFDSLISISITGEVVRLDFGTFDADTEPPADGEEPPLVVRQRVIMPINGFTRAFGMQEEIIARMLEEGVIMRNDLSEGGSDISANKKNNSPNFGK